EVFGPVPLALASWRQVRAAAERIAATIPDEIPPEVPRDDESETEPDARVRGLERGLELRGVSARWPRRAASGSSVDDSGSLEDATLSISPGERVLVTGPSGAGKTTLAHVL